ncbi:MAG: prolyl oligopeptidase family serine peptidase [Caulobacteraceae bacterium]|nr:prolyl oligopeptidase family serine peptidase [Caulobacteraceae bacterium]
MFRLSVALVVSSVLSLFAFGPALAAPPPIEAYGKLPAVEHLSLSPSGQRYAFIAVVGDKRRLVAETVDGSKILLASEVGTAKVVGVSWAGEDHLLVEISHTVPLGFGFTVSKLEMSTVVVINLQTRKAFAVFDRHPTVSTAVMGDYGVAQIKGRWYGFFGGITYGSSPTGPYLEHSWADLYRVDLDSGAIEIAAHGSEIADSWLVGPDGEIIARTTYDQTSGAWQVITGSFAGRVLASGKSKLGGVDALARGRTPDTIVVNRPVGDGASVQELKLSGEAAGKSPEDDNADDLVTDRDTGLWVGTLSRGDQPTPKFFAAQAEARIRGVFKAFPGQSVSLESRTSNLDRIVVKTSGLGDSGTYWLVDMTTHKADPLAYERPEIGPDYVGTIKMVDWKASDGLALRGVLNLPPGRDPKNLPVIVMPHGGPEARDYPVFDWWAQLFASRGYVVFQPNFRGSSGYGLDFRDAGFGQIGRKMETDVSDGLDMLVKQGIVDPKRACIVGWSYGGYAAQAGVTVQHGLYRCAVSMAGISDLPAFLEYVRDKTGEDSDSVRYWKTFMGAKSIWESELGPISPVKQAAKADAPLLLVHGKDDTVVPLDQSQEMARALKAASKPVELVTLDSADHWLLREDTRLAMAQASLDFVLKYNPPDPEPATPVKQAAAASP